MESADSADIAVGVDIPRVVRELCDEVEVLRLPIEFRSDEVVFVDFFARAPSGDVGGFFSPLSGPLKVTANSNVNGG